jgi:hypothetical protein
MAKNFYKLTNPKRQTFYGDRFEIKQHLWAYIARGLVWELSNIKLERSLGRGVYKSADEELEKLMNECEVLKRA